MDFPTSLDEWNYETVTKLVQEYEYEPGFFDFKAQLNATKAEHREKLNKSIRKTAGAMANTGGGYLIFGIQDRAVHAETPLDRIQGIQLDGDLRKQFGDKLKEMQPSLHFETIAKAIPLPHNLERGIFVVRIPESLRRPHMVNPEGVFYRRDSGGSAVIMDYFQVRDMMLLRRPVLLTTLRWELEEHIIAFSTNYEHEAPFPAYNWIASVRRTLPLPGKPWGQTIPITDGQARYIAMFWLTSPSPDKLRAVVLQQAIHSGEFMSVQPDTGALVGNADYEAMQNLSLSIERYADIHELLEASRDQLLALHDAGRNHEPTVILGDLLHLLYFLHDRQQDILRLSSALLEYIADPSTDLRTPTLNPINPLADQAEKIAAERPTHADVQRWIADPALRQMLTGESLATSAEIATTWSTSPALSKIFSSLIDQASQHIPEFLGRAERDGLQEAFKWLQAQMLEAEATSG